MKNSIGTNLRNLRPTNPGWVGFTLQDALQGLAHHVATGAEALPDLLKPGSGGSGFVALRWLGTEPSGLELSPAKGRLVELPPGSLTPALLSDLGRLPLIAFDGAEVFGRLAELTGRWPKSYLSLLTMVRVLENGATTDDGKPLSHELDAVLERYGLPSGPQAGNPTPRLHKLRDILFRKLSAVNAGRKVRRGHGCDRAVQKCGAFMNNEACIALWKTGPTYGNGWPRAR